MFNLPKLRNILLKNIINEFNLNANKIVNSDNLKNKIKNRINISSTLAIINIIDYYLPSYKTMSCQ